MILQMKKITSIASLLFFLGAMIFVASKESVWNKNQINEFPDYSQMENTQVSIADKGDTIISMDSLEKVTEEIETEQLSTEDESTEETVSETTETEIIPDEPPKVEYPTKEPVNGTMLTESSIYSFFQTPHAWWQDKPWSGEWGEWEYAGKTFGNFGCGMCCMANIYDTLSPYEVSPWDMFEYAQTVSSYSPSSAGAAISWSEMKSTLNTCGFACELYCKPGAYEDFKQHVKSSQSVLVLVSSANDNTYWETTKGHYVTIWLYDEATDTVFLADSGKIARNRQRIPLRYVYNALKTASDYQYMTVNGYDEASNVWKANGITENWIRP